nr:hypothetical protein Iba_chr03aCG15390 [Ipomoea batatas]GMC72722.1 hypothetical protein Iba_chr03bCG14190 [Ipomoea batatas]GMC76811.1 hypothetical protein Iba_chr03eCG4740 [Ipomoea batatas]GME02528.1 hypothetical protein Iba_scaffold137CG0110 [Ipomoea batatas]
MPRMSFDLWESKISIIWVHTSNFFSCWSPEYLNNLYKLVYCIFSREKYLPQKKLSKDTAT